MSETGYVISFIVLCLFVVGLLVAFVMASMGWFQRSSGATVHEFPNEYSQHTERHEPRPAKQYWPHTSALREDDEDRSQIAV